MKTITIEIPDYVALELEDEAEARHVTVEEIATQRISFPIKRSPTVRPANLDVADSESVIGMFAGDEEFSKIMDEVVAKRHERYAKFQ